MLSIDDKMESEDEDMEQDSVDTDKSDSSSSDSGSGGSDEEDSSDLDEVESERRRNECTDTMNDLETQFSELKEQLYTEKLTQVVEKLQEVRLETATEYTHPVSQLQDSFRVRLQVAGIRSELRKKNIDNVFEAEEQATKQHYESEKQLIYDLLYAELRNKIRRLKEDRNNVDISSDLLSKSQTLKRRRQNATMNSAGERRRKPVSVSGPYIIYMLRDNEIIEDLSAIKLAIKQADKCKREVVERGIAVVNTPRSADCHQYIAKYEDGRLFYEGDWYNKGNQIIIETKQDAPVKAQILSVASQELTIRRCDGTKAKLYISQLQLGKYTIRHSQYKLL